MIDDEHTVKRLVLERNDEGDVVAHYQVLPKSDHAQDAMGDDFIFSGVDGTVEEALERLLADIKGEQQ